MNQQIENIVEYEKYVPKEVTFNDVKKSPDLSLDEATIDHLARILLGGGAEEHAFENGSSQNISAKLRSGKDGFLDEKEFPRNIRL